MKQLYNGQKAELVAIYGRRRIGKTYLVDETFKGKITFRHAGLSPVEIDKTGMLKAQLEHFYYSLLLQGMKKERKPESWLEPFTLNECEEFFSSNQVKLSRYDIAQSYMILGGIPYYMNYFQSGMSLAQNIDNIFFAKNGKLKDEYNRLFASIFSNPELMKNIVGILYTRNAGYTRAEIIEKTRMKDGEVLSKSLNALIASDFVIKYVPFGKGKKEHYKLIDPFCMFYLHFVEGKKKIDENFWKQNISSQQIVSWRGFAYENVCFNHIQQIKKALGISGVVTTHSAWSKRSDDEEGAQIDLLISRNDNVLNMCEMKYYSDEFVVNKEYYQVLLHRQEILKKEISRKISIHNTLITTFGLTYNEYSGIFSNVITLDDLFVG